MNKSILLLSILLIASAFAGCISDEADPADSDGTSDDSGDTSGAGNNSTTEDPAAPQGNQAPVPSLNATNVTGVVPVTVTFTLDGTDADGLFYQWTFDANGDGTVDEEGETLPTEVSFTFEQAGNYTAVFNLSDGEDAAEATLDLSFTEPPQQDLPEPKVFTGTITGQDVIVDYVGGEPIELKFWHNVTAKNVTISMDEVGPTALDLDWDLLDPSGTKIDGTGEANDPTGTTAPAGEPSLYFPDENLDVFGEYTILLKPFTSIEGEYKITVTWA